MVVLAVAVRVMRLARREVRELLDRGLRAELRLLRAATALAAVGQA
jgi:hypothetical protein